MTSKKEEFRILDEREHILLRSGMYVGSTSKKEMSGFIMGQWKTYTIVPALLKIIDEVLDNSVDEFIRTDGSFADRIDIKIENSPLAGPTITIRDNGRGIPIEMVDGEYRPVLAWTRARAGTNFSDDENRVTMGMNGVGAFCTNVFSETFTATTASKGKKLTLHCTENASTKEVSVSKHNGQAFTEVSFSPDMSKFEEDEIGQQYFDCIRDRLMHLAVCHPGIQFTLNGEKILVKNIKQIAEMYGEHFVCHSTPKYDLILTNSPSEEFRQLTYVNGLNLRQGGTHVDMVINELIATLRPAIQKKLKIDVLPNQIKQHMTMVMYVRGMKNMKFSGQTKEELSNTFVEVKNEIGFDVDALTKMARKILNTPELIDPITASILYKKELAERLELARKNKKAKKEKVLSHIQAQSDDPDEKILFITEGQSAIGQLINVRDPQRVGGYPLKGKVKNVYGMKPVDIMDSNEIKEMSSILGLEIGRKATDLKYGRVAILTDADVDGGQIACLLVVFFILWPELFEEQRIYKVMTPLVIAKKGKEKRTYYTLTEWKESNLGKGWDIEYYKGLGSLPEEEYDEVINNPRLVRIDLGENYTEMLNVAFGPDTEVRKEWLAV